MKDATPVSAWGGLVEADTWLAAVIESSDDAIVSKNLQGTVISWNPGAERLFGYKAEEVVGGPIAILAAPGREDEMPQILERLRRGERIDHFETVRRRKDGSLVEVSLTVSPIRDAAGRIVGASKIARDIGERKRSEAALRESEARFRRLANRVPVLVWFSNPYGGIRFFGERWYDYTGLSEAESLGFGWRRTVHPDDWNGIAPAWTRARRRKTTYEAEFRCRGRDGAYHWFLTRAEPLRDEAGGVTGWFGTSTDIHERKLAEGRQRLLMAELDHRVKNVLATIQSIAHRTLPRDEAARDFEGRLAALAKAHELLADRGWRGAGLGEIVRAELAPFPGGRIAVDGEEIMLAPKAAQTLTMVVHELATNAAKYGALAAPEGRLRVAWNRLGAEAGEQLRLEWQESGGPRAAPAGRRGFGSVMIERGVRFDLRGEATLAFLPQGLRCTLLMPLATLLGEQQPAPLALPGFEWPEM